MELDCIHLTLKKCFAKFNDLKHLLFKTLAFLHLMNLVELLLHHIQHKRFNSSLMNYCVLVLTLTTLLSKDFILWLMQLSER